jgi:hypothetical protein
MRTSPASFDRDFEFSEREVSAPDVPERLRRHCGAANCIGDRSMPEVVLEAPRIHSAGCQCVSPRVAQHVDVNRERQLSGLASAFYHASDTHSAKRLTTLIEEDVIRLDAFLRVGAPQLA